MKKREVGLFLWIVYHITHAASLGRVQYSDADSAADCFHNADELAMQGFEVRLCWLHLIRGLLLKALVLSRLH